MKIHINKILVFTLLSVTQIFAQAVTWQKWYDYSNFNNDANDVIQTFDGGFLFLGQNYEGNGNSTILIKTNILGTIEWTKLIDRNTVGGTGITCLAVQQSNDSGFVVSGYTSDSAVLFKTFSDGNIRWLKKYAKPNQEMSFYDHKITLDGGIIACGELFPPFGEGVILKTDSLGNLQWDSINSIYYKVIQDKDSNYYFGHPYQILKLNKSGIKLWSKAIPFIGPFMIEDNNNYIYSGGFAGIDTMFLHKIDSSGNLLWQKKYYPGGHCQCLCLSNDRRSILLAGYIDTLIQGNIAVSKVDLDGNLIFNKQIYSAFGNNLSFLTYAVKSTSDQGFILTGFTNYPRFTSYQDNILAVKTDSLCNAPMMVGINNEHVNLPSNFILYQNYPNPFNPITVIKYELKNSSIITLKVFDNLGKKIATLLNSKQAPGRYNVEFTARDLPSGIYFYKMDSDDYFEVRKMILLK